MPTHKYASQIRNHPQVSKAKKSKNIGNQQLENEGIYWV